MIVTEKVEINGVEYTRNYSDIGVMIERDDGLYEEAIDPIDTDRVYTETDIPIEEPEDI